MTLGIISAKPLKVLIALLRIFEYNAGMDNSGNKNRYNRKKQMVDYKGGKCAVCGYSKCLRALIFHHLDPKIKSFNFGGSHCRKWADIKAELDKCLLLCQNCHCEIHDDQAKGASSQLKLV